MDQNVSKTAVAAAPRLPMPPGIALSPQQWRVLTDVIFPSAREAASIVLAMEYCAARRLDVFKRPVHIVSMWNSKLRKNVETPWPGINELQTTAARTGQWAGMDAPEWGPLIKRRFKGIIGYDEDRREVMEDVEYPEWCSVTVWRLVGGARYSFCEPVYWAEAYSSIGRSEVPNEMWRKRPRGQLHKVAKAASLRAAFPEEMGSEYTSDEMAGKDIEAGGIVIEGTADHVTKTEKESVVDRRQEINKIVEDATAAARRINEGIKDDGNEDSKIEDEGEDEGIEDGGRYVPWPAQWLEKMRDADRTAFAAMAKEAFPEATLIEDVNELAAGLVTIMNVRKAPADLSKLIINLAYDARVRLKCDEKAATRGFHAVLIGHDGIQASHEAHDRIEFARLYADAMRSISFPPDRIKLTELNAEALEDARSHPEAEQIIDAATAVPATVAAS